jgi:hypothetical protein
MAPPAPRECNQPARSVLHRKQFAAHRIAASSAAHWHAQPARSTSAPRESHPARIAAHCIANNPHTVQRATRTDNQPAAHRPQRTAHTSHLQLCARASQYFALVSFGSWY